MQTLTYTYQYDGRDVHHPTKIVTYNPKTFSQIHFPVPINHGMATITFATDPDSLSFKFSKDDDGIDKNFISGEEILYMIGFYSDDAYKLAPYLPVSGDWKTILAGMTDRVGDHEMYEELYPLNGPKYQFNPQSPIVSSAGHKQAANVPMKTIKRPKTDTKGYQSLSKTFTQMSSASQEKAYTDMRAAYDELGRERGE